MTIACGTSTIEDCTDPTGFDRGDDRADSSIGECVDLKVCDHATTFLTTSILIDTGVVADCKTAD